MSEKKTQIERIIKFISQEDPTEIFQLRERVGQGSYGRVYKGLPRPHRAPHTAHSTHKLICCTAGVCKADNKLVAIKEICFSDIKMIEEIKVEIALLQCMHASPQLHATH